MTRKPFSHQLATLCTEMRKGSSLTIWVRVALSFFFLLVICQDDISCRKYVLLASSPYSMPDEHTKAWDESLEETDFYQLHHIAWADIREISRQHQDSPIVDQDSSPWDWQWDVLYPKHHHLCSVLWQFLQFGSWPRGQEKEGSHFSATCLSIDKCECLDFWKSWNANLIDFSLFRSSKSRNQIQRQGLVTNNWNELVSCDEEQKHISYFGLFFVEKGCWSDNPTSDTFSCKCSTWFRHLQRNVIELFLIIDLLTLVSFDLIIPPLTHSLANAPLGLGICKGMSCSYS